MFVGLEEKKISANVRFLNEHIHISLEYIKESNWTSLS